ncbi:hypothetical protein ISF6_4166 [Piscinibacter sakaiensis]|uniref:Uncharacterized protein n=1 Tax=Piscinibacter sakaiensis TaxID=1547922 RepID=A0A0K8P5U0_PISS1|nr:hypothetical protein ISF6_4166 [Piscinibacter sakaiensis]
MNGTLRSEKRVAERNLASPARQVNSKSLLSIRIVSIHGFRLGWPP